MDTINSREELSEIRKMVALEKNSPSLLHINVSGLVPAWELSRLDN